MTTKISEVKLPSIDELVKGVANGTTTAVEAAGMCFSRIDEEDATIHAYLSLDRERALTAGGEDRRDGREGRGAARRWPAFRWASRTCW